MMHRPAVSEILKEGESYYSLVVAVAKRAREITEECEEKKIEMLEKSVTVAVEEFAEGKYVLIEDKDSHYELER